MQHYRYDYYVNVEDDIVIRCLIFEVEKETKCGYWITNPKFIKNWKKWVSKYSKKRYAYPTKNEAFYNFKLRKEKELMHLKRRLKEIKKVIESIDNYICDLD